LAYLNKQVDGIFTEFPHLTYSVYTKYEGKNTFPMSYIKSQEENETFLK
jgi:hypothetical protein